MTMKIGVLSFFLILMLSFFSSNAMAKPDTVKVGAYMMSVHDINYHDKEYSAGFWLWFLYKNKNFDFISQVEVSNAKTAEATNATVETIDDYRWCLMKMKAVMKQSWGVHEYPFDKQHLDIHIENTLYDDNTLVFVADTAGAKFHPNINVDGWRISSFKTSTGLTNYHTAFGDPRDKDYKSEYSNYTISMDLERDAWGLFFKIFLGMYIAFCISMISFTLDPEWVEPRFGLPVGGLFASVGNKYIIDSLLPESSAFNLVDILHNLTFVFIFITIAISAIALILDKNGDREKSLRLNKRGGLIVLSSYIVLNLVFVLYAVWF